MNAMATIRLFRHFRLSFAAYRTLAAIYATFMTFALLSGIIMVAQWTPLARAQFYPRGTPQVLQQHSDFISSLQSSVMELERWRREVADPQREAANTVLAQLQTENRIRDAIMGAFVIPVILIIVREIAVFLRRALSTRSS